MTPGGFNPEQGLPQAFFRLQQQVFLDEARPSGWVSQFGHINGGTFFFIDLIGNPGTSADVWWDFTGQAEGFWMSMLNVFGRRQDGTPFENIYAVPSQTKLVDLAHELITIDGITDIFSISFYGLNPETVPDMGSTILMFAGVTGILLLFKSRTARSGA